MNDACSINRGMLAQLLAGRCPNCRVGLLGHFGNNGVPHNWEAYSCPHCGYNFKDIETDMLKVTMPEKGQD